MVNYSKTTSVCFFIGIIASLIIGLAWYNHNREQVSIVNQMVEQSPHKGNVFVYVDSVAEAYTLIEQSVIDLQGSVVEPLGADMDTQKVSIVVSLQHKDAITLLSTLSGIATDGNVLGVKSISPIDFDIADTAIRTITITLVDVALL